MKKLIAVLLAMLMLASLCACGDGEGSITDVQKTPTTTASGKEPAPTTAPSVEMTTVETGMFTVSYPTQDAWSCGEEDIRDGSGYSSAILRILNDNDDSDVYVYIFASVVGPYSYREDLYDYGFDEYALVEENAYDFVAVGGQQFVQWTNEDGDQTYYMGRNESAEVTMGIEIEYKSEVEDGCVSRLLDNLQFHFEETGNEDGPWYWEGTPFSRGEQSVMVGTYTINSTFIPMEEPFITHETFEHDLEIIGDKAYILSEGVLREFAYDGASLRFLQELALDNEFDYVDAASDGTLILSGFLDACVGYQNGAKVFSYDGPDYFAAAPDGSWGISYFTRPDQVEKYSFDGGVVSKEPFGVTGLSMATGVWVDDSYVYIAGDDAETSAEVVQVYDHAGTLLMTLLGEDGRLGSITFVTKTPNGFLALDGNMRTVVLWNADGAYIGEADDGDLFGTNYPWFCAADLLPDGSIVVIMTDDRDDESAMELVAFRLTGF